MRKADWGPHAHEIEREIEIRQLAGKLVRMLLGRANLQRKRAVAQSANVVAIRRGRRV